MSKSFTSDKLDWLNAVMSDGLLNPTARNVAYWIAQHINQHTNKTILSDELLADKVNVSQRSIRRSRDELKKRGWIVWNRALSNVYELDAAPMTRVLDLQNHLKEQRAERRELRKSMAKNRPDLAASNSENRPFLTREAAKSGQEKRSPMSPIHLIGTPELTPKERGPSEQKVLVVDRGEILHVMGTTVGNC